MLARPYQRDAQSNVVSNISEGKNSNLIVIPVGGGKSVVIAHLANWGLQTHQQQKVLIITHRKELSTQNANKIRSINPHLKIGFEKARETCPQNANIMMASIQTVGKEGISRIRHWANPKDICMVLIDEAHHIPGGKTYQVLLEEIRRENPNVIVVGFTATPKRGDGERLDPYIQNVAYQIGMTDLVEQGYLSPLHGRRIITDSSMEEFIGNRNKDFNEAALEKALNNTKRNRLALDVYMTHHRGEKSIAFCTSKAHAHMMAELFQQYEVKAAAVTEDTPDKERENIVKAYHQGDLEMLTNCGVFLEGFDEPLIKSALMLRPTKSPILFEQAIGRTARLVTHPNPEDPEGEWLVDWDKKSHATIYEFHDRGAITAGAVTLSKIMDLSPNFDFDGNDIFQTKARIEAQIEGDPLLTAAIAEAHSEKEIEALFENHNILAELSAIHYAPNQEYPWMEIHENERWIQLAEGELVQIHQTPLGNFVIDADPINLTPRRQYQTDQKLKNPHITQGKIPAANGPHPQLDQHHLGNKGKIPLKANNIEAALKEATQIIQEALPCDVQILKHRAETRGKAKGQPSESQLWAIQKNKVPIHPEDLETLTKGQAHEIIERIYLQKKIYVRQGKLPDWKYKGVDTGLVQLYDPKYLHWLLDKKSDLLQKAGVEDMIYTACHEKNPVEWYFLFRPKRAPQLFPNKKEWVEKASINPEYVRNLIRKDLEKSPVPPWPSVLAKIANPPAPQRVTTLLKPQGTPNPQKSSPQKPPPKGGKSLWETPASPELPL